MTLPANTSYYLVTEEFSGGDQWYEYNNVLGSTSAGTINGAVYSSSGSGTYNLVGSAGQGYGPTSLRYKSGSWTVANETRYVYDGMLPIQERDGNNVPRVTYTRGRDLSGSLEGAGGIGGLLARTDHSSLAPDHSFYHADGSGNITMLINQQQVPVANYHYDPFGDTITRAGPLAEANTMRFSSKEVHRTSGLYYYGFRFYEPNLQRWLNQDPLGEEGGINLYQFVQNAPVNRFDPLGLACWNPFNPEFWGQFLEKAASTDEPTQVDPNSNLALLAEEGMAPDGFEAPDGTKISGGKMVALVGGGVAAGVLTAATTGFGGNAGTASGVGRATPLATPKVTNAKLANIVKDLYKGAKTKNPIGTGSTADAVRNELATGLATGGKHHSEKAKQYIRALEKWLEKNPNQCYDRTVAESLKRDLESALAGN